MSKKHIGVLVFIVIVLAGLFVWYEVRPAKIRSYCAWYTREKMKDRNTGISANDFVKISDYVNERCLNERGLRF